MFLKYYILKVKPWRVDLLSFFNYWVYFFFIRDGDHNVTGSAGARRVPVGRALAPTWRSISPAFLAVVAHFTRGARVTLSACVRSEVMCELLILHWSHLATSSSRVSVFSHIRTFFRTNLHNTKKIICNCFTVLQVLINANWRIRFFLLFIIFRLAYICLI